MPKIFHVNWFRQSKEGKFLWPGFGDNIRVIDWMCQRVKGGDVAEKTPIGYVPKKGTINLTGIESKTNWDEMFTLPKNYWIEDSTETRKFLETEVGTDLPAAIEKELVDQEARIKAM
jgi:phosphoenolpyruvate carboxykinase (GTP)